MKTQKHPKLRRPIRLHHFVGFFFFSFGLWVWSDFGLLMVVNLILVVLWLVACTLQWLWIVGPLVVVVVGSDGAVNE